jgi:hypothetical protein
MIEFYFAPEPRRRVLPFYRDPVFIIQHFKHPFTGHHAHLQGVELVGNDPERPEQYIELQV